MFDTLRAAVADDEVLGEIRAMMSAADINNLPDDMFGYIEPGGKKDASGKTVPRSLRHFPIHDAAHVRNALARMSQSPFGAKAAAKIHKAAQKFGIEAAPTMGRSNDPDGEYRRDIPAMCVRAFDFEAATADGTGRTLEGYAAVFGRSARISARDGDFDETIAPGAFTRSLRTRTPVMQFEHGRDPRVGAVPIAAIKELREDDRGLYVRAELFDNPVVEPVRQAIAGKAIPGMSFRFQVPNDSGQKWTRARGYGEVDRREVRDADVFEVGPVVFPAYDHTTIAVRSMLANLDAEERTALIHELAAEVRLAVDLTDLTGRPGARSTGGGDNDANTQERSASPAQRTGYYRQRLDDGALRVRGILQ